MVSSAEVVGTTKRSASRTSSQVRPTAHTIFVPPASIAPIMGASLISGLSKFCESSRELALGDG